jgi:tetratricopeptide (TPR) repeat protein
MLDRHPRKQLCLIVEQYGQGIMTDPKRCRGLLNDLAPQHHLETNLLMMALEQDVAKQLLKPSTLISIESQLECFAQSLHDAVGIEEELAYWAVESWALALCVISRPVPRATPHKPDVSPVLSPFVARNNKKTRQITFVVFFTAWMVAGLLVATIFDLSSNSNNNHKLSKPPTANQAIVNIPNNSQDDSVTEHDAWTENNLGDMYYFGRSVVKNDQKAAEWYLKSAEQGYAIGQCNLGFMYTYGYGVPKDYQKAVDWYRKAAEQGDADGQNNLGIMYENGYGVVKDMQKAVEWYTKAVEQGHYGAQQKLRTLVDKS